jgi:MOSC domain-containing protein YiiM
MLRGVDLAKSRGRILCLGECRIHIFNETKPCEQMDAALPGLKGALYANWAGGAFGEVVVGGTARVGDAAMFIDETAEAKMPPN